VFVAPRLAPSGHWALAPAGESAHDAAMASKSTGDPAIDALYRARNAKVDFVDVPELGFVVVDGAGAPGGDTFADALQALYSVSYGARSIAALHRAIAEHGSRPRGHHHEIYLGDPRRSAPEKLRTILRQPIEPVE
jgi:hypothetical protein